MHFRWEGGSVDIKAHWKVLRYTSEFRRIGRQEVLDLKMSFFVLEVDLRNGDWKKTNSFPFTSHLHLSSPILPHLLLMDPHTTSGSLSLFLLPADLLLAPPILADLLILGPAHCPLPWWPGPPWLSLTLDMVHTLGCMATSLIDADLLRLNTYQHEPFLSPPGENLDGSSPFDGWSITLFSPHYLENKLAKYPPEEENLMFLFILIDG